MGNLQGFDARTVEPRAAYQPLPPGEYEACIVASEMMATKDGNGSYLKLTFQIVNGEFKNRTLTELLNLKNANKTTVQIAEGTLSAICRAVGVMTPADSSELHNKTMRITVAVKKRGENDELRNEIKGYKPRSAGPVSSPSMVTADNSAQYVASGPAKAPWQN